MNDPREIDKKHNFRQFLSQFSIFLKTGFSAEVPINHEYYAYNSVPSVEILKLYDNYRSKRKKAKMGIVLLKCLWYRDSNQIMIYIDCNRIKGSFDKDSL